MMICCPNCQRWYDNAFPRCTNCGYSSFGAGGETFNVPPPPPELTAMGGQFQQQYMAPPPNSNDINSPNYVPDMGVPSVNAPVQQGYPVQQQGYPVQQQGYPVQQQGYPVQQQGYPVQQQNNVSMQQPFQAAVPQSKTKGPLIAVICIIVLLVIGGIAIGIFMSNKPAQPAVPENSTASQSTVTSTPPQVSENVPSHNSTVPPVSDDTSNAATGGTR
ncbi:MAG: hypothetical protein VZR73_05380 [Acutalibacteraceae bacterium]|nr:hypothetical protein [Acutalibacteraceae bacterium]